ncbi:hypothetical protein K474DRAFT_1710487 [Panus rudis PR-1116 ss-1]|nr:hypothetical protein K474DRAFT_1710487 [Panus rudis PR-1116 ss-1]
MPPSSSRSSVEPGPSRSSSRSDNTSKSSKSLHTTSGLPRSSDEPPVSASSQTAFTHRPATTRSSSTLHPSVDTANSSEAGGIIFPTALSTLPPSSSAAQSSDPSVASPIAFPPGLIPTLTAAQTFPASASSSPSVPTASVGGAMSNGSGLDKTSSSASHLSKTAQILVGVFATVGGIALIAILVTVCLYYRKKKKAKALSPTSFQAQASPSIPPTPPTQLTPLSTSEFIQDFNGIPRIPSLATSDSQSSISPRLIVNTRRLTAQGQGTNRFTFSSSPSESTSGEDPFADPYAIARSRLFGDGERNASTTAIAGTPRSGDFLMPPTPSYDHESRPVSPASSSSKDYVAKPSPLRNGSKFAEAL